MLWIATYDPRLARERRFFFEQGLAAYQMGFMRLYLGGDGRALLLPTEPLAVLPAYSEAVGLRVLEDVYHKQFWTDN